MATNLVEFFQHLFGDPTEAAKFQADPSTYLEEAGVTDASYEAINEAVVLACDAPVSQGAVVTTGGASATVGSSVGGVGPGPSAPAPHMAPPPPPPPPPAAMPPAQAVEQIVNYYVTEVYETTNVDDRDVYQETNNINNVNAEEGSHVDITNETDTTIASGDGSVAVGEDGSAEGVATGDGAVAAGDDISAPVNTGENSGVIADGDVTLDDSIIGDGNTQVNDNDGQVALGDGNVQAQDGGQAAGGDLTDNDINITDSDLDGVNFGEGGTAVQDNDTYTDNSVTQDFSQETTNTDSFNTDASVNDSFNADVETNTTDSFNNDQTFDNSIDATDSFDTDNSVDATDSFNDSSDNSVDVVDGP